MARSNGAGWLKWLLILLILGGLAWGGWWYWKRPGEKPAEYRTASVSRGDVVQAVSASGQLAPVANVQVGSQISGMIQKLYADFNSSVTQGQVIAELDPSTYRANVTQAEGELANAKSARELARIEAERAKQLAESKLIPVSDYDKALAQIQQAEAQVKIREAMLEKAIVDLNRCTIYAPTNGIVISRNVDVGQTVAASLSAPTLYIIANDLRRMQIDAMVSEADIGGVEVGQEVTFTVDAYPSRTFSGQVTQIRNQPITNQNVVTYNTIVSVENRDQKLKPGMTANVSIITAEREGVLKIPNAALRFRPPDAAEPRASAPVQRTMGAGPGGGGPGGRAGGGPGMAMRSRGERNPTRTVYTLESTNAVLEVKPDPRQIKTGISDGAFTEVTEGLEEGDTVVVGVSSSEPARQSGPPASPFGGGMRRF